MAFRSSIGSAFAASLFIAPLLGLLVTLVMKGHSIIGDAEANLVTMFILGASYMLTLLGLAVVGLPLTGLLSRIGGDLAVGSVNGMIALFGFVLGLEATGFGRQAWLTLSFSAAIFTLVYLLTDGAIAGEARQAEND